MRWSNAQSERSVIPKLAGEAIRSPSIRSDRRAFGSYQLCFFAKGPASRYDCNMRQVRRWVLPWSTFVVIVLLSPLAAADVVFSWSNLLRGSVEDLSTALDNAKCSSNALGYRLPLLRLNRQVEAETFISWDEPNGGLRGLSFSGEKTYRSSRITNFKCRLTESTDVTGSAFDGEIFRLTIRYHRCRSYLTPCIPKTTAADSAALEKFKETRVLVPFYGYDSKPSYEQFGAFEALEIELSGANPASKQVFSQANICGSGLVPVVGFEYQCSMAGSSRNGAVHLVSFLQLWTTRKFLWTTRKNPARDYLWAQTFVDQELLSAAYAQFIEEANETVTEKPAQTEIPRANDGLRLEDMLGTFK
jgi:hypothetical protein